MNNTKCELCPRDCKALRTQSSFGVCGESTQVRLARAALHYWEEPTISGKQGSGTVFFSGCNLHCVYCQNAEISNSKIGKVVSVERLSKIFFELQLKGANNINLVTPTHFVLQIIKAIKLARECGLKIPIVYNTSGYEKLECLSLLKGYIDIFLTDFKYASPKLAKKYSSAPDYPQVASSALDKMFELAGPLNIDNKTSMMKSGIIVRHLLLPNHLQDSKHVLEILAKKEYAKCIQLSIMNQYTPPKNIEKCYPQLASKVSDEDYEELLDYADWLGFENVFCQIGETANESFIPDFNFEGV